LKGGRRVLVLLNLGLVSNLHAPVGHTVGHTYARSVVLPTFSGHIDPIHVKRGREGALASTNFGKFEGIILVLKS
jgi:hypothetical protein